MQKKGRVSERDGGGYGGVIGERQERGGKGKEEKAVRRVLCT